ncbi:MAG: hypothetical protein BWX80_03072 [Candidatus Hydrogenedentes bacterium ADurb.Bin101]|nr:MAG: hypothetical protein BWX80_03072 [Candidatus Hydrogenedentes bacterium ADurb.Bin101]
MHFSAQHAPAPFALLRGGAAQPHFFGRVEGRVVHAQGRENVFFTEGVEGILGGLFDHPCQQDESQVGVGADGTGRRRRRTGGNALDILQSSGEFRVPRVPRRQSGRVRQQMAQGYVVQAGQRDKRGDGLIQLEYSPVPQQHHGGGGGDHLGQGRQIIYGIGGCRFRCGHQGAIVRGAQELALVSPAYAGHCARCLGLRDGALQDRSQYFLIHGKSPLRGLFPEIIPARLFCMQADHRRPAPPLPGR